MDPLSFVLQSIRLDGAVFLNAEFTAPWCVEASFGMPEPRLRLTGADHVVFFHCLIEGTCLAGLIGSPHALALQPGDLIFFPHDHRHRMGSYMGAPMMSTDDLPRSVPAGELIQLCHGGGGDATRFVCGYLACNRQVSRGLLSALPEMFRVSLREDSGSAWLFDMLLLGVRESTAHRPGAASILTKLSELLFAEALRRYADDQPAGQGGWLAGLRDPLVGRAMALLHQQPAHPWTVDSLARAVASSRSALAGRFVRLTGAPPMQYLASHRLALAAQALRCGQEPVARIAENNGYASEAAFTRAFKRRYGVPPSGWRRQGEEGATSAAPSPVPAGCA
ncbi:AraC family transcriptional regulator [Frateuria terrea]|uniref:AraC-type DNA-binding protein n=1 Tax=Frateuria terrea TaxID=529704 RepID=A0A1H6QV10_9GAMM|nr:AraC family transcriptional regulator [Frateuria terrea]SEI44774.1 AraC-type DNA-binding protein [Frateuria terrea]SFP10452.1 AraC-type DNA-binding protein [Frateuria terrea]